MNELNHISPKSKMGANFSIGKYCIIEDNVTIGDNVIIENFCILKSGVKIGNGTHIKNYVELREDTIIGENCIIDSRVSSSGNCKVGNNVTVRYDSILARKVEIGDGTYICPRVMTNNLNSENEQIGGARIGKNCFVGTNAVLQYGISIEDNVIIGSMAFVNKDCQANSTYIGIPAKKK